MCFSPQVDRPRGEFLQRLQTFSAKKQALLQSSEFLSDDERAQMLADLKVEVGSEAASSAVELSDLCLTFEYSAGSCVFGSDGTVDLTQNGAVTAVDVDNVEEYVELTVDYTMNKSVHTHTV